MSKEQYYDISKIASLDADYNIILGERTNGKSFAVKEKCINDCLDGNGMFVYLRRWDMDIKKSKVDKYFTDEELIKRLKKRTKNEIDCVEYRAGDLYFSKHVDRMDIERVKKCGYAMSLSGETHDKSLNMPNCANVIFEEFVTNSVYLDDEIDKLFSVVSTIARRKKVKVWLIGNTISRLCPYFSDWQLTGIPKQKKGTIDVYEREHKKIINGELATTTIKIAVEFCEDIVHNTMFFGNTAKMVSEGEWHANTYPKLPYSYKDYTILYRVCVIKMNMVYLMEVLTRNNRLVLYVYPINKTPRNCDRILKDGYDENPLVTNQLIELTRGDMIVADLIKSNKICFSDNLTGTEFYTLLKGGDVL